MKRIRICSFLVVATLGAAAENADRKGATFVHNSMGFSNGVTAKATIAVEPPAPLSVFDNKSFSIWSTTGDKYHRVISDDSQRAYFGYDISTERIPHTNRIRVTIAPLSLAVDQLEGESEAKKLTGFRFLVLPRYPRPVVVENGDTIALDLLVSANGKQKIVDYIEISYKPVSSPKH